MNEILQIVSLILNLVLGGSLIVTIVTLKATRREADANARKAEANADSSELSNTQGAIKIWRDLAVEMSSRQDELAKQVEDLSVEVRRLKNATNKVIRLLDRITPENLEEMVAKIKDEIETEHSDIHNDIIAGAISLQDT
ncbi:MAG TPA: hypothetical protein VKX35_05190 [Fermentimonas sp.]|nr:hypothetical protein [Fermentimonas sp.]